MAVRLLRLGLARLVAGRKKNNNCGLGFQSRCPRYCEEKEWKDASCSNCQSVMTVSNILSTGQDLFSTRRRDDGREEELWLVL